MGGQGFPYDAVIVKNVFLCTGCALLISGCHVAAWSINSPLAPSAPPASTVPQGSSQSVSANTGSDNLLNVLMLGVILSQTVGGGGIHEARPGLSDDLRIRKIEPDASRRVSEQDCTQPVRIDQGNLKCR